MSPMRVLTPLDESDTFSVPGLSGHWHRTLELPNGYQHFNWYQEGENFGRIFLNDPTGLRTTLSAAGNTDLYLYTHHEIYWQSDVLRHTRSSPNWEGGLVTYATCKHLMRSAHRPRGWIGVWLAGLCPSHCADNCLLFVGRVALEFPGNWWLGRWVRQHRPEAARVKAASTNPRGDLYRPLRLLKTLEEYYNHQNYEEPPAHTRSVESYAKSPGSAPTRPDGRIPKWWRDLEYTVWSRRPPSFVLTPCYLFSQPLLHTRYRPRRAVMRLTTSALAAAIG